MTFRQIEANRRGAVCAGCMADVKRVDLRELQRVFHAGKRYPPIGEVSYLSILPKTPTPDFHAP